MVATLAPRYKKLTMVKCGGRKEGDSDILIRPRPNPTAVLRLIGARKLKKAIDRYFFFPSTFNRVVKPAKRVLGRLIREDLEQGLDVCVIQSVPPHGLTTLGLFLKRKYPRIRWLVDWQDLWSYDESYRDLVPRLYQRRLLRLERMILNACDLNITTNAKASEILRTEFQVPEHKLCPISHPFHPAERDELHREAEIGESRPSTDAIKIGFLGRLTKPPKVPGERVLQAIADASKRIDDLELHIYGQQSEITRDRLAAYGDVKVFLHDHVPHLQVLKDISRCNFLLVSLAGLPNCNAIMHAKLPHYLILDRPIIALVPTSSFVADTVRTTKTGVVIDTNEDWGLELARVLEAYAKGNFIFEPDRAEIDKFSWNAISKKWISAIEHPTLLQK